MMQDYAKITSKPSNKANKDRNLLLPAGFIVAACAFLAFALLSGPERSMEELTDIGAPVKKTAQLAQDTTETITEGSITRTPTVAMKPPTQPSEKTPLQRTPLSTSVVNTVQRGDTLAKIFANHSLGSQLLHSVVRSTKDGKVLNRIKPGQTLKFEFQPDGSLNKLTFQPDFHTEYIFKTTDKPNRFESSKLEVQYDTKPYAAKATIEDSLFLAGMEAGLSDNIIMELAGIFGWDIDFAMDIRKGDKFTLVYEQILLNKKKVKDGNILAAEFLNQGKKYTAIRFKDSKGKVSYYSKDGKNLKKTFLRSPVAFTRISSRFSLGRKHPILHRIRAHKGVDYAAKRGTPIKAVGDGKVIFAGRKGGYGKVVILQHGQYSTLYAHMHRYGKGIRVGRRVKQGKVIGSVGSTGLATGPHLHYEFRVNGVHKNPLTVKFPSAAPLPKSEQKRFKQHSKKLLAKITTLNGETQFASKEILKKDG